MEDLHAASAPPLPAMADPDSSSLDVIFDVGKDPDPASLEAAMQVPITVMLGPAGPLLRKLHSLVPSHLLSTGEIRLLKVLCISLKNMSGDDEASFMVRWWMKMVRELCYDTEDHLDEVSAGAGADHDFSGLIACAKDTCERRKCFQWSPKTTKWVEGGVSRLKLPVPLGAHVEPPKKLVEMLALDDDEKMLKVIPINGCAGVGKTTVARTLYHRHGKKFQCRAFITVSRNPYMRGLLNRMLSQLKAPLPDNFPDVPDLIDAINKHLQGKRYFIVIDDLWTASVWNIISRTFPRGDSCSRIIITTQIDDVALECCCYYPVYIYKMEPLNDDESRELFGRVFGSQDSCPPDIKEVPYDIIRKCGGLPLAIVNIANLATEPSTAKWKYIQDSFPSTSVGMKDFLNIMYNCLPPHLRTCLLYLSMYAHSYVIKKNELIKHWIAEGFLGAVEERDTEKIAQGYFDELVIRGMVQAMDTGYNGKVLSYSVREIVMDFIRRKSREENFVITVDYNQSTLALPDKVRRLSVQFGGVKSAYIPESIVTSQVRSLIFWGFFKCVPSSFQDYGLLRILILHIWADKDNKSESVDLRGIGELFLLKYLKIECNITIKLPDQTIGLQHLETLEVDAKVVSVPSDIVNLKRLLHLQLPSEYILPSVFANMTSLRTLGYFDLFYTVEDILHLRRLTNLQDLQLTCSTVQPAENLERNVQRLGSILEKLRVLQSITLVPAASGSSCVNIPEDGFSMASPPLDLLLQRIELSRRCCIFFSLPKWFAELRKLCILKIAIRELSMNDTDLLKGLPALTTLTLYIQTAPADKIVIHKGGFQELTYFKFMCAAPCLSFVQGAMPKVQELELGFNSNKQRSHTFVTVGFRHLTCLTEVSVKLGVQDAEEVNINDAESGLEAAVRCHPNSPITRVQFVDVISYGEEKLQEIRDGKKKKRQRLEEKRHGIEGGKRKRERSEEKRHEIEGDKKKRERSEEKLQEIEGDKKRMERSVEHVSKQLVDNRYARTGCIFTPVKHHQESVDVVMGAMGPLLPKLLHLLKDEYNMEVEVKDSVESLHKKLEGMQASLREVAMLETAQLNAVTRIWAREVRDLSYDTEDTIDSLPVHIEGSQGRNKGLITWVTEFISGEKSHQEIFDAINVIIKQARDLASRPERYMVRVQIAANPNAAPNFEHHRLFALYNDPKEMVGINISRDEVIRKLTHGTGDMSEQLKIVSIVGMGGLGKSTLAKAVYDNIQGQYHYTAFVTVSRSPDWRKVYIDILFQIDKQKYMNLNLAIFDERQLIDEVRELLANERYLIVFDDIWDVNSLEVTKFALIDSGVGSRVVTTTRILEVAVNADDVYSLKALSHSHSEELFNTRLIGGTWKNNRLFDGKDNIPCVAPKVPENLLQKCGGVPLAIIMMASLLERTPRNVWSKVYNNIGFGYEVGGNTYVDGARKILLSSYYDLPYHLRACLLHLHIFPENYLIKKETLIWKWAAEGLIVEQPGRGLFEVGEEYLKELINRNVVMPVEDDSHCGEVIGCRVHYLVLEMICYLSTEENFVTVLDGNEQYFLVEGMTRRLAVQKWAAEQGDPLAKIIRQGRLRSFYTMSCHFSAELSLSRFRFLRVIAIEECTFSEGNLSGLEHLGKLHLLRYIRLYGTAIKKLPEEIGDLIYLQTLDLMGTGVRELPRGVARLRQLKCLRTDILKVPYWMGNLASLEELRVGVVNMSENFATDLGKLTELRELDIWIESLGERQKETLVQSMRKLEKIQILRLRSFSDGLNLEGFDPPGQLRELLLSITPSRLPAWINVSRVPILSHLYVNVGAVTEQDLENLGSLPKLISLDLVLQSDAVLSISDRNGAFPRLRYFGTSAVVRFLPGAMPRLEFLRLGINVQALEDANVNFDNAFFASTLENLPSLQKVVVRLRSTGDVEAIDEALKHAVDQHPNRPSLHVITINWQGNAC